jgi:hypothetical protein
MQSAVNQGTARPARSFSSEVGTLLSLGVGRESLTRCPMICYREEDCGRSESPHCHFLNSFILKYSVCQGTIFWGGVPEPHYIYHLSSL